MSVLLVSRDTATYVLVVYYNCEWNSIQEAKSLLTCLVPTPPSFSKPGDSLLAGRNTPKELQQS